MQTGKKLFVQCLGLAIALSSADILTAESPGHNGPARPHIQSRPGTGHACGKSFDAGQFVRDDRVSALTFTGSEIANLFTCEVRESFAAVLLKNYHVDSSHYMPGYITASVEGRPWHNTMRSRDGGTFLRELVLWGYFNHACLLTDCLIKLVEKNKEANHGAF